MRIAIRIGTLVESETEVHSTHGTVRNTVDLALQERVQGAVHGEASRVSISQVHACRQHGHGKLASLLHAHGGKLVLYRHVLGSVERELQSHVAERLANLHSAIEQHAAAVSRLRGHKGLDLLRGRKIKRGVHHIAGKLYVTALLYRKCLERNDGQLILHLARIDGITAEKLQIVSRIVYHAQLAATLDINIVRLVCVKGAEYPRPRFDVHHQKHVESS